ISPALLRQLAGMGNNLNQIARQVNAGGGSGHDRVQIVAALMAYNGSSVLGVVTVDETGTWTLAVTSALPDGVYPLTAIAADAAGNSSGVSNSFTFTVDTVPLQPPVVNEILDDVAP
ncbi:Ig-like domain-containing protein, partial [Salmonella enterica subsp. enterica serovar Derby]|nr:Ig-like domain-containing protein [Salmonella enterica subsp. enterica serovar Derby]